MDKLEKKYIHDELTVDELEELKQKVNSSDDETVGKNIQELWDSRSFDYSHVPEENIDEIRENLNKVVKLQAHHHKLNILFRVAAIAAAVIVPLLLISTVYFYSESKVVANNDVIMTTAKGEHASITLPDGSTLTLNEKSRLSYSPENFNKGNRNVSLDGEAYFKVAKDAKHPFDIITNKALITVLGTVFDLSAYKDAEMTELSLEKGSVRFLSNIINSFVVLKPGQKAIMSNKDGNISVIDIPQDISDASSWRQGELVFHDATLSEVLKKVESAFDVKIILKDSDYIQDLFSGTVSDKDLSDVLQVIDQTYHLHAHRSGNVVLLEKVKQ